MITEVHGNLLAADVDALVNTVNTVGVMGKGIALQFKRAYPAMFADYASAARRHELTLGHMHVWETGQMTGPRFIINFPTKQHWKTSSTLSDIAAGLDDLVRAIHDLGITSIAIPPLGCGQGGLQWRQVEPLIHQKLSGLSGVDVIVFPPEGAPPARDMVDAGDAPPISPARAALLRIMSDYAVHAFAWPSLIEVQKLMYFLQEAGEPLRLEYNRSLYGPYADDLRKVIRDLEGHYIIGFGDGSLPVPEAEPLEVRPGAADLADKVIHQHEETRHRIDRVLDLTEGFESAYGLELLASVHWITTHDPEASLDDDLLVRLVQGWTRRKGRMFGREHILTAARSLRERGWLRTLTSA